MTDHLDPEALEAAATELFFTITAHKSAADVVGFNWQGLPAATRSPWETASQKVVSAYMGHIGATEQIKNLLRAIDRLADENAALKAAQPRTVEGGDRAREAAVIAALADLLDEHQAAHDVAECAAPAPGETGRQACIDNWTEITEEPAEWLRKQAAQHNVRGFEYLRQIAYEAWYAGYESGCEDMENGGHSTTNPYAEELTEGSGE